MQVISLTRFLTAFAGFGAHTAAARASDAGITAVAVSPLGTWVLLIVIGFVLARVGMGLFNVLFLEEEPLASIEQRHPYLPPVRGMAGIAIVWALLFALAFKTIYGIAPFTGQKGLLLLGTLLGVFSVAIVVVRFLYPRSARQYMCGFAVGTVITFALIAFERSIFAGAGHDPFIMTAGILCLIIGWKLLFGPWNPGIKAFMLSTFIFWISVHLIATESGTERLAHILAVLVALIPAVIWCLLFLQYHRERLSVVVLMFFSGMLATAPILLYDKVLRSGLEMQFFLFRIVPESFTQSSNTFVTGRFESGYQSAIMATLISFLLVGFIEEMSKFWVLSKSGKPVFSSIDDVIQLGIFVAIGFAFAENVLNPNYFLAFVSFHLVQLQPDWSGFFGNFFGRAVLTNMVHIVSTGVLGYYYGLALFADSYLRDEAKAGRSMLVPQFLHRILRLPEEDTFRRTMLCMGIVFAIVLHGLFNFLVTLPSILPGEPQTIGDLLGAPVGSWWHAIAILIVPSLFYVVGGFWLLSTLFGSKRCTKERGRLVRTDKVVLHRAIAS